MTRHTKEIDALVGSYADADRSDTFVSYNDAIVLAREVRRLRKLSTRRANKTRLRLAVEKVLSRCASRALDDVRDREAVAVAIVKELTK